MLLLTRALDLIYNLQYNKIGMESKLWSTNGQSYYRWIEDIGNQTCTVVSHVKSHTGAKGIGSWLIVEVDHYTSKVQSSTHLIPIAPIPTFFMEDYMFIVKLMDGSN